MTDLDHLSRDLTDRGLLIAAGFVGLQKACIPADAPKVQVDELRNAFFAGAAHLFASIMNILDPGEEPTEADMRRMSLIDAELKAFLADFEARLPTVGSA